MRDNNSTKITGIVFSKDRAMQLDATLQSLFLNCVDTNLISLKVIYTGSTPRFLDQYDKLRHAYSPNPLVDFIQESNFQQDVFKAIGILFPRWDRIHLRPGVMNNPPVPANQFVLFLVDDNLFVRRLCLAEIMAALNDNKNALGFALQLGTNINYCYPLDISIKFPNYVTLSGGIIKFHWPGAGDGLNYPLEVSSSVYRLGEIANLLTQMKFSNPNRLEAQMATKANHYRRSHPYLLCYKRSVTFCNPVNKVQRTYDNKAGTGTEYSADHLAGLFDEGFRIDIQKYQGMITNACHQEADIHLSKRTIGIG